MPIETNKEDILDRLNGQDNVLNRIKKPTKPPIPRNTPISKNTPLSAPVSPSSTPLHNPDAPKDFGPVKVSEPAKLTPFEIMVRMKVAADEWKAKQPPIIGTQKGIESLHVARGNHNGNNGNKSTGPGLGNTNAKKYPDEYRLLMGIMGNLAPHREVAEQLGVDKATVSRAAAGLTGRGDKPSDWLRERLEQYLPDIQDTSVAKFRIAAGFLTSEAFEAIPLKDRALIASKVMNDMSKILSYTARKEDKFQIGDINNQAQVVVMTPPTKSEHDYDVVEGKLL